MMFTQANAKAVARLVSEKLGTDIMQNTRKQPIMEGRQVAMYILYEQGGKLRQVGGFFGRNHASVIHSKKVVCTLLEIDKCYREKWKSFINTCCEF